MKTTKVYDFSLEKTQGSLVRFLKTRGCESTVADMMAGTGLAKHQVETSLKGILDEYSGRLKVTESGELLYSFPDGMRSTQKGFGPSLKRFWSSFRRTAARVLSFLFKVWIVAMLVGYFIVFLLLTVLAVVAAFAASAGGGKDRDRSRRSGGGFGGMYLVSRIFELALRMWFYSKLFDDPHRGKRRTGEGRAFYKSVFAFVFGEGDPNSGFETEEKKRVISYIRYNRGVITVDELMAITGREEAEVQALINRYLLEFDGDPRVTENGAVVYVFPELLRTTEAERAAFEHVSLGDPLIKKTVPFSANKPRTNRWISFFNVFNLLYGAFFLIFPSTPGMAAVLAGTAERTRGAVDALTFFYSVVYNFLGGFLGAARPEILLSAVFGIVPAAFSVLFFAVPLIRSAVQKRRNEKIRRENLRKLVYAQILDNPRHVDPRKLLFGGSESSPRQAERERDRIVRALAAAKTADPIPLPDGSFAYRFAEIERELAELRSYRGGIDVKSFDVGKTVFDTGQTDV